MAANARAGRRLWLARASAALLGWPGVGALRAEPVAGPLRILVAYPPGGTSDAVARALAVLLARRMGVPVQVENRPGAGGTLALDALARSRPDGRMLALAAATSVALRSARPAGGGEPVLPVAGLMRTPLLLVGTPALAAHDFPAMVRAARTHPGSIRWATTGEGTTGHAVLARVQQASGAAFVHVPYKGGGQQINDAIAGHFEVLSTNVAPTQLQALRSGTLRALAVGAPARLAVLPETPTLAELGFASANLDSVFGLFAPPGTPQAQLDRLNAEVGQALHDGALRQRLLDAGNTPLQGSPALFAAQVAREAQR